MNNFLDPEMQWSLGSILGLLVVATCVGLVLKRTTKSDAGLATIANLNARIRSWWVMCLVFAASLGTGGIGTLVLFGLLSFLALREFITLTPTRRGDHMTLFWCFFVITPLHYYFIYINWYGFFAIFIPVYAFLFIPIRSAIAGDTERFLERTAKIQWGLMIAVYCVSHAPALLLLLPIKGYEGQNAKLLLYLILVVQLSDVLQYVWGKLLGKRKIAPLVSPNKTVEGFVGGIATATLVGTAFWWMTPFSPLEAAVMSLVITLMGFAGGLTMSAIKRDRGIKDYGSMIGGHGGILDRIDSVCFAAPIFFHLTRWFHGS